MSVLAYATLGAQMLFRTAYVSMGGGKEYGIYAALEATLLLCSVGFGFGISTGMVKLDLPTPHYRRVAELVTCYWLLVSVVSGIVYWFMSGELRFGGSIWLMVAASANVFAALSMSFSSWSGKLVSYHIGRCVVFALASCAACLWLVGFLPASWFYFLFAVICVGGAVLSLRSIVQMPRSRQSGLPSVRSLVLPQSLVYWWSLIAVAMYGKGDIVLLAAFGVPASDIGMYAYVYGIMSVIVLLPAAMQKYLERPLFAGTLAGHQLLDRALVAYLGIGAVASAAYYYIAPSVFDGVLGLSERTGDIARLLAPSIMIVYIGNLFGLALMTTSGFEKRRASVQWLSAITNALLNVLWIPGFGVLGAAFATTIGYVVLGVGYLAVALAGDVWHCRKHQPLLFAYAGGAASFIVAPWLPLGITAVVLVVFGRLRSVD